MQKSDFQSVESRVFESHNEFQREIDFFSVKLTENSREFRSYLRVKLFGNNNV